MTIDLNGIRLRNRLRDVGQPARLRRGEAKLICTARPPSPSGCRSSGSARSRPEPSPTQPREGHFTLREDWKPWEFPRDAGPLRQGAAPGRRRLDERVRLVQHRNRARTSRSTSRAPASQNRIISLGGFSADEFGQLVEIGQSSALKPGDIAAVEFNVSCHNVNFPFETILEDVLRTRGAARPATR